MLTGKETLQRYLKQAREVLPWKPDGLSEREVRWPNWWVDHVAMLQRAVEDAAQ